MIIYAQAPGGVAAAVWYKADVVTATDNSGLNLWVDQMGTGYNLVQATAAQRPTFSNATTLANFNPTVTFNSPLHGIAQGGFMAADPGAGNAIINRIQGSIYTAGKMKTLGAAGLAGFDATMDFPGQHVSNDATTDKLLFYTETGSAYTTLSTNLFAANTPFVSGGSWLNGAGSTASNPLLKVWLDGNENVYNSTVPNVNLTTSVAARNIFRIGRDTNWGSHDGQMNEVIVFANPLTAAEKARVDSYLSVKWGTTLLSSYVNSTNGTVWNYDAAYQNNILGIARDGNSALYQKQSRSENPGQKLVIGAGNTLANTNAANTNTLTNGQFLLVGDNGLKQSLNTPLSYTIGTNGATNYRFASIWKVQNTGGVGPVTIAWPKGIENLYLVQSSTATFDSSSTFTPMTTEMTVNGVVYNTVNVTFGNGQYFTFAGYAHAPGGVFNALSYWYRADKNAANTGVGSDVTSWTDFFSGTVSSQMGTNALPKYAVGATNYFNFNPGVSFTAGTQSLGNTNVRTFSADSYDVFTFTKEGMTSGGAHPSIFRSLVDNALLTGDIRRWDGLGIVIDDRIERLSNTGGTTDYYGTPAGTFSTTIPSIMYHTFTALTTTRALNGAANFATTNHFGTGVRNLNGGHLFGNSQFSSNGSDNQGFIGHLGETIIYGAGNLSTTERRRVDSYMAIKYGLTLERVATDHYLGSNGGIVWDGSDNNAYNNNIFGITHDELSALHQKQSTSVNANQKLIIGAGSSLADTNAANANSLTDGQYLLVGDNGLKQSLITPLAYTAGTNGATNYRFESIWKEQNTGSTGTVTVAWPKGIKNLYLVQSPNDVFGDGDDVFTPMTTEMTVNGVVYNTANVTLLDDQYFTFAGFGNAPGGVATDLSYWYRADVDAANTGAATDVTSWKDVWNGNIVAQMGTNTLPKYVVGAANYFNYNPGLNFTSSTNQSIGNISSRTVTGLDYDIFTFTKEALAGPANSRVFSSLADITKQSGNIGYWDGIGLNLNPERIERVNYPVTLRYLNNPGGVVYSGTIPSIMYNQFRGRVAAKGLNGALENSAGGTAGFDIGFIDGGHVFGDPQFSGNGSDNRGFTGHLGETIIYGSGSLSATDRRKVDSYLAIKYGITMGRVNTDHYLDADGTLVWNGGTNTLYNNNVFGVAREDIGLFEQKVSKSVNAGTILTVATTNDFVNPNLNGARTGFANDKTYFLLGDNNNVTTTTVDVTVGTNTYKRIQRAWMAQEKKSDAGALFFEANLAAYNLAISDIVGKVIMLVADDANFTTNVQAINPLSNSGGKYIYNQNIADGKYITFAAYWFDTDGDGMTDACDLDNDNDGILDVNEKSCELTGQTIRIGYIPNSRDLSSDNGYTFDGQYMNNSGALKLTNPANFGPAGTVKANIVLVNMGTAPITKAIINSLNLNAIFLGGIENEVVSSSYLSASEFDAIKDWSDDSLNNLVVATQLQAQQWGRTIAVTSLSNTHTPTSYGNQTSIFNGPFGNITSYNQDASRQWFFLDAVSDCNTGTLAVYGGNATRAEMYIDGTYNDLMISGVDILTTKGGVTAGNAITSTNDKLFANIFAFVAQQSACTNKDTDGDSIPDYLDLDSDSDGCLDAIEGDENVTTAQLVNAASGLSVGIGSSAANQNLCASGTCVDTFGVPTVVNSGGAADIGGDQGQAIGSSANASVSTCIPPYCYKPGIKAGTTLDTKVGITSLNRAGADNPDNWPMVRKGGWIALESQTKGFVPNRVAFDASGNPIGIPAADFVIGMMVYDSTNKCMKMYTSTDEAGTTFAWHCISTQSCPD